jgi:hypothetical protein
MRPPVVNGKSIASRPPCGVAEFRIVDVVPTWFPHGCKSRRPAPNTDRGSQLGITASRASLQLAALETHGCPLPAHSRRTGWAAIRPPVFAELGEGQDTFDP